MRWYNSITTRITLLFVMAFIGILVLSFSLFRHLKAKEIRNVEHIARLTFRYAYDRKNRTFDLSAFSKEGFVLIKDIDVKNILARYHRYRRGGIHSRFKRVRRFRVLKYRKDILVLIKLRDKPYVVLKYIKQDKSLFFLLYLAGALLAIILLYIGIIKSILPLKTLRYKIKEFANGNYDIECRSDKKDEIALLSNEFHSAVKKIKSLKNSREFFLRNIMHELKTPITKGKIASEMIENFEYRGILQNVFNRQEELIEEFSRIEKLYANELKLNLKVYNFEDIVDFATDLLSEKRESIIKDLKPLKLNVDFELFGVAIKNLLDNGINYSYDKRVEIKNNESYILISNRGDKLKYDLNEYFKPHLLYGKSKGLGFGLYITLHVIKLHKMDVEYKYEDGKNYFKIII